MAAAARPTAAANPTSFVAVQSRLCCARVLDDNGELQLSRQTFGTTTSDLLVLGDWLASHGVTLVGMESTSVFWKPVELDFS